MISFPRVFISFRVGFHAVIDELYIFKKGKTHMAKKKEAVSDTSVKPSRRRTPEARENQLIALAYDAAERRLLDGTATSQEIVHLLRMGSAAERRKAELDREQLELMREKAEMLRAAQRSEELYANAIKAVQSYKSPAMTTTIVEDSDV